MRTTIAAAVTALAGSLLLAPLTLGPTQAGSAPELKSALSASHDGIITLVRGGGGGGGHGGGGGGHGGGWGVGPAIGLGVGLGLLGGALAAAPYYGGYDYGYDYAPYAGTSAPSVWYWCDVYQGYYPAIPECSVPWREVVQ